MASSSHPQQLSGPDPGSVLCNKCKESVQEPSQNTENVPVTERLQNVLKDWISSPQMWPIGYLMQSPYSPLQVEREIPKPEWRDAFEDLLALESGGEMISHEFRKQEHDTSVKIGWERAKDSIEKINKLNARDFSRADDVQNLLNELKSPRFREEAEPSLISWADEQVKAGKELFRSRIQLAEAFKADEAERRTLSASKYKNRGHWMASLITSGALRGWTSNLLDSEDGDLIYLAKEVDTANLSVMFSERELHRHFEYGEPFNSRTPGLPLYRASCPAPAERAGIRVRGKFTPPPAKPELWTRSPERPCFFSLAMAAERITLPNGKTTTRVVMKKRLTNGDAEEKVMVQEPGKVLQEVEKAQASIFDRMNGLDQPI